jgi:hypothetical protein
MGLVTALLLLPFLASSQVTVTGPTCVTPGTVYQYLITGNWDSTSFMYICIKGGTIQATGDSCTQRGAPVSQVLVSWTTIGNGTIVVTSSLGNAGMNVGIVGALVPGSIDSLSRSQVISPGDTPKTITCSAASNGACSPMYVYQWQRSIDRVSWQNMDRITGASLTIDSALTQTTFYRRQVTETTSSAVSYSDVASVFVGNFSYWKDKRYLLQCCPVAKVISKPFKP